MAEVEARGWQTHLSRHSGQSVIGLQARAAAGPVLPWPDARNQRNDGYYPKEFDNKYTRNTFDINAIPLLKELTHLPIVADPSHAIGVRRHVSAMTLASVAAGADGLIIETHPDPDHAVSDGDQSLTLPQFRELMEQVRAMAEAIGRRV